MRRTIRNLAAAAAMAAIPVAISAVAIAQAPPGPPAPQIPPMLPPTYEVDLMTQQGAGALAVQWKTMEAKIVETKPIPEHLPGYNTAYDIAPHAGESGFDDSKWPAIKPEELSARRGGGHVSFIWYRTTITVPPKMGEFDPTGAKAVLDITVETEGSDKPSCVAQVVYRYSW